MKKEPWINLNAPMQIRLWGLKETLQKYFEGKSLSEVFKGVQSDEHITEYTKEEIRKLLSYIEKQTKITS